MRPPHPKHWFGRLPPGDAARFIVALEEVRQEGWSARHQLATIEHSRKLSAAVVRRLQKDRSCQYAVLRDAAQALLDDDLALAKGLLRRLMDATIGAEALAGLTEVHPKSLIRMLGRDGNPRARHLTAVVARLAQWQGVRLKVT